METDVVIIGAGTAGLSAAKELSGQGVSFVVMEASHRIGGRAYSEEIAPDVWFDLGCAYLVAGPNAKTREDERNPLIDYANSQGAVIEQYLHESRYIYNGRPLEPAEAQARQQFYNECEKAITNK